MENIHANGQQESFELLAQNIHSVNQLLRQSAANAINKHVTCRNWLIGYYIVHYFNWAITDCLITNSRYSV